MSIRRLAAAVVVACGCGCGSAGGPPAAPRSPPPRTVQLNATGVVVDVEAAVVPDHVTVVDFWAEYCGACVVVSGMLAVQIASEPRILVRKVDVGEGPTPVTRAYQIGALPHFRIYDKHRRLRYVLVGNDCVGAADLAKQLLAEP